MRIRNQPRTSLRERLDSDRVAASRRVSDERFLAAGNALRSTVDAYGKNADASVIRAAAPGLFAPPDTATDAGGLGLPLNDAIGGEIWDTVLAQSQLLRHCTILTIDRGKATIVTDESGGDPTKRIRFLYVDEESAIAQSKLHLGMRNVSLSKVAALVPVTEELLEDSAAAFAFNMKRLAGAGLALMLDDQILNGRGAGRMLGIYNAPSLVVQAAEGAQTADTINATNAAKMDARCSADSLANRKAILHPDARSQVPGMGAAIYTPGDDAAPAGRVCGAPIIPHESAPMLGDLGDITFADLSQYLVVVREGGVRESVSIHMWFDRDLVAFKFTLRVDGFPLPAAPVPSLNNPSVTRSPFVCLAAR